MNLKYFSLLFYAVAVGSLSAAAIQEADLVHVGSGVNYHTAVSSCNSRGLKLIRIENEATNRMVFNFAVKHKLGRYWIDANDIQVETKFVYTDGSPIRYAKWHAGEPNNYNNEDCVHGLFFGDDTWNDINCADRNAVICYRETAPFTAIQIHQLVVGGRAVNYQTALNLCRSKGLELVRVQSEATNNLVMKFAEANKLGTYWMDGNDIQVEGRWVYADGTSLTYSKWHPGEPNNAGKEDCLHGKFFGGGLWNDISCNSRNDVICYKKVEPFSRVTNVVIRENQLFIASRSANYQTALNLCRAQGFELIKVQNDVTNNMVVQFANAHKLGWFWMDGNDIQVEGKWVYADGTSLTYSKWHPGEPNNAGKEDCLHGNRYGGGLWNDVSCNSANAVICYKKDGPIVVAVKTTAKPKEEVKTTKIPELKTTTKPKQEVEIVVEKEIITKMMTRELLVLDEKVTYEEALNQCRSRGMKLVEVSNAEANKYTVASAAQVDSVPFLIDATDSKSEGVWLRSDGTKLAYTNFKQGEPNGGRHENCVLVLNTGFWQDVSCASKNNAICYKDA